MKSPGLIHRALMMLCLLSAFLNVHSQEKARESLLHDLEFMEGRWQAVATDSSFTSVLEYRYTSIGKLMLASNHLYGRDGTLFRIYEGIYFIDGENLGYLLSGPNGEIHRGSATFNDQTVTHLARIEPGTGTQTYRSEMILKDGRLYYYANYSRESEIPETLDYSSPLVYYRIE
jgi:hypothetical protein